MNSPGGGSGDLLVSARSALLDAAEALSEHRESLVLIGAQAVYLRTGGLRVALAEATKDSDVALDPRTVADEPLIDDAMTRAASIAPINRDPGSIEKGYRLTSWSQKSLPVEAVAVREVLGYRRIRSTQPAGHEDWRHA